MKETCHPQRFIHSLEGGTKVTETVLWQYYRVLTTIRVGLETGSFQSLSKCQIFKTAL